MRKVYMRADLLDFNRDPTAMTNGTAVNGEELYVSACASCHQLNGQGTQDQFYPSLTSNRATGGTTANNLVMAIVEGVHRKTNDITVQMPAFGEELSNAQIAAVSNYVLQRFGNDSLTVSESDVVKLRDGGEKPLLVTAAPWLIGVGAVVISILAVAFGVVMRRRSSRGLPA